MSWVKPAELVSGGSSGAFARPSGRLARIKRHLDIPIYMVVGFLIAAVVLPRLSPILPPAIRDFLYQPPAQQDTIEPVDATKRQDNIPSVGQESGSDLNDPKRADQKGTQDGQADSNLQRDADAAPNEAIAKESPPQLDTEVKKIKRKKVSPRVRRRVKKLNKKARGYIAKRRYKSAKRLLGKAISLDPSYASNYRYLGQALQKLRDPKGALSAYTTYLQLAPSSKYAASVRKQVKKLNR